MVDSIVEKQWHFFKCSLFPQQSPCYIILINIVRVSQQDTHSGDMFVTVVHVDCLAARYSTAYVTMG